MNLTKDTCLYDLRQTPEFRDLAPYLVYHPGSPEQNDNMLPGMTIEDLHAKQPTWAIEDMLYGLKGAQECSAAGRMKTCNVYAKQDILKDPDKSDVKLFAFQPRHKSHSSFALLLAGGGYGSVAAVAESLPVAVRLLELGMPVFVLNYRVFLPHLFPRPMEDLQAAFQYLLKHAETFDISMEQYLIGGFSAGAHLAESWNTEAFGYRKNHIPAPQLTVLVYPMLYLWEELNYLPESYRDLMLNWYFGTKDDGETHCAPYEFGNMVDESHSPVYLVHALDDTTISPEFSKAFLRELKEKQISCRYEFVKSGGHGFGLGSTTPAAGWPERAVQFMEDLLK